MCDAENHDHHHHDHGIGAAHSDPVAHAHADGAADEFRVVISGKGGVGKTSFTATLARLLARESYTVLALDADPQMNLPYVLGLPRDEARRLVPLSRNAEYVEEKTGARPGSGWGLFFRLNPDVSDVVERFGVVGPDGVSLLVMGTTVQPAAGCLCPENSLLAAVANSVILREGEAIVMDTQAGVEHFGRALAKGFHHAIVLTDPTFSGVQVAVHTARLAAELGIPAIHLVVNRVASERDFDKALRRIEDEGGFPFATWHALPYDAQLLECEPDVSPLLDRSSSPFVQAVADVRDALIQSEEAMSRCAS